MFTTPLNQKTVQICIKRRELVDLLLACNELSQEADDKWSELHGKLRDQLDKFDEQQKT